MRVNSRKISWLGPGSVVPTAHWAPKTYHIRNWNSWSDAKKLRKLREISEEYARDPDFRAWVIHNVMQGTENRDYKAQASRILSWVQSNIRYFNEPNELIQSPNYTIRQGFGDCDDSAVLIGAMAHSIALPWHFVLAGRDRAGRPFRWSDREPSSRTWGKTFHHIYVEIGSPIVNPTEWISLEPTIKGAPLGYDVVKHGYQVGPRGQPVLPELSGFGDVAATGLAPVSLLSSIPWGYLAVGIAQGVVTGVILELLMRRRKRK